MSRTKRYATNPSRLCLKTLLVSANNSSSADSGRCTGNLNADPAGALLLLSDEFAGARGSLIPMSNWLSLERSMQSSAVKCSNKNLENMPKRFLKLVSGRTRNLSRDTHSKSLVLEKVSASPGRLPRLPDRISPDEVALVVCCKLFLDFL